MIWFIAQLKIAPETRAARWGFVSINRYVNSLVRAPNNGNQALLRPQFN